MHDNYRATVHQTGGKYGHVKQKCTPHDNKLRGAKGSKGEQRGAKGSKGEQRYIDTNVKLAVSLNIMKASIEYNEYETLCNSVLLDIFFSLENLLQM